MQYKYVIYIKGGDNDSVSSEGDEPLFKDKRKRKDEGENNDEKINGEENTNEEDYSNHNNRKNSNTGFRDIRVIANLDRVDFTKVLTEDEFINLRDSIKSTESNQTKAQGQARIDSHRDELNKLKALIRKDILFYGRMKGDDDARKLRTITFS